MKLGKGVIPPGGWHYLENETKISSWSKDSLVTELTEYRIANNLPLGSPQNDIENYVCTNWPHFCLGPKPAQLARRKAKKIHISTVDRIAGWINSRLLRKHELETQDVAERRAAVCLDCPKNIPIPGHCSPCNAERKRKLTLLTEGKKVPQKLGYCNATYQANEGAIWLPKETLRLPENKEDLDPKCWMIPLYETSQNSN